MSSLPHPNTMIGLAEERRQELIATAEAYHHGRFDTSSSERHLYRSELIDLAVMLALALLLVAGLAAPREPSPLSGTDGVHGSVSVASQEFASIETQQISAAR